MTAVDDVAQAIWQEYVVETGMSLPEGLAAKMAQAAVDALELTEFTCDGERWWSTRIEPIVTES